MKNKLQKNKYFSFYFLLTIFYFFTFYFLFSGISVFAASFFFNTQTNEWRVGDQFATEFFLNTNGDDINAIEGRISYPKELLELKEIRDGNSIINFWIEKPQERQATSDKRQEEIVFSGVTPGGYKGENGSLFSLVFRALKEGQGIIEIRDIAALKNDGKGTASINVKISNFQFNITDVRRQYMDVRRPYILGIEDKEPPESFMPEIAKDRTLFEGKWFVVFATQDKISGIGHYELKETRQRFLGIFSKWIVAESPYILQDQELRSYVFVKAVDKAGNERIVKINPQDPLKWYENYENWSIIVLGFIIVYAILKFLWRRYLKK